MKIANKLFPGLVIVLPFVTLVGCAFPRESISKPPGEGYGLVSVSYNRDLMHEYRRDEVYYWDKNGKKTLIWKYLSNQLLSTNDLAVFHGYLTTGPADPDGATRRDISRLFAVQGFGPAVDITDEVVLLWTKVSGTNFIEAIKNPGIGELKYNGNGLIIKVFHWAGGGGTVELTWDQVMNLIQEAKNDGKLMKDPGFGTPYLKRDLEAKVRKP